MKKFKYLIIMVLAVTVFVSCSTDDDNVNALVGTWEFTEIDEDLEINVTATFNENLSGEIYAVVVFNGGSETENSSFTWSTDGNKLTMVIDGDTETSTYSISGDKLTITDDDGETTVLTRQ